MPKKIKSIIIIMIILILITSCSKSTKSVLIQGIEFEETEIFMNIGETALLKIIVSPDNATNQGIDWVSSDNDVATITDGVVTALSAGVATITATSIEGGHTASCRIIINSDDTFVVASRDQWEVAIDYIKNGSEIFNYNIIIINDFHFLGSDDFTFGERTNIEVSISGKHTLSLNTGGYLLHIGPSQNVKVTDTLLLGFTPFNNYRQILVLIEGEGAILSLEGEASIQLPIVDIPQRRGVDVYDSGEFYLKDNASIKHTRLGVLLYSGGKFFMSGGEVADNIDGLMRINYSGVRVIDGFFEMTGGSIARNIYYVAGSNILLENESIFNMYGGEITENVGGISLVDNATFNMYGGSISNNRWAIGISDNGSFEMYDGSIMNNIHHAVSIINQGSIFKMINGSISGSSAVGVFMIDGLFNMIGGIIYGNEATINPPNLMNKEGALHLVEMRGTAIYGDGSDILPHIEGELYYTNYTISFP